MNIGKTIPIVHMYELNRANKKPHLYSYFLPFSFLEIQRLLNQQVDGCDCEKKGLNTGYDNERCRVVLPITEEDSYLNMDCYGFSVPILPVEAVMYTMPP